MAAPDNSPVRGQGTQPRRGMRRLVAACLIALHAAAFLAVIVQLFWPLDESVHAAKRATALDFPASYAVFGFLAGVLLVLLAIVLRRLVMRGEHYYGEPD